ncbi:MAG: transcriptional repressor LexA [Firmicutes bacterium]|nr:transcriptional repressor LexA [Bacillota bacterium]
MHNALSKRQAEILEYINKRLSQNSYSPSIREICCATGLKSTSSVHAHICTLERLGYISKTGFKRRSISSLSVRKHLNVPVLGDIVDCSFLLSPKNIKFYYPISSDLAPNKELFMLTVPDDSMINSGILKNDYVIIQKQNIAKNGDIVAAMIDDAAIIRTFYNDKKNVRLQPQNTLCKPIVQKNINILGKVIGVFRNLL